MLEKTLTIRTGAGLVDKMNAKMIYGLVLKEMKQRTLCNLYFGPFSHHYIKRWVDQWLNFLF